MSLDGVEITVATVTSDGRPRRVLFRFALPLESPRLLWYAWDEGQANIAAFQLPPIGAKHRLGASLTPLSAS